MSQTILVSAGHGAGDPGAAGPGAPDYDFTEADLTLELRDLVADELERVGYAVLLDGDRGESRSRSYSISQVKRADAAVDLHFNASRDGGGTGVECFSLVAHEALASLLARAVAKTLGLRLRGKAGYKDPSESRHPSLGFCSAGGVLLEVCFMNRRDLDAYLPKKAAVAAAIAGALRDHLNGGAKPANAGLRNDRTGETRTRRRLVRA